MIVDPAGKKRTLPTIRQEADESIDLEAWTRRYVQLLLELERPAMASLPLADAS